MMTSPAISNKSNELIFDRNLDERMASATTAEQFIEILKTNPPKLPEDYSFPHRSLELKVSKKPHPDPKVQKELEIFDVFRKEGKHLEDVQRDVAKKLIQIGVPDSLERELLHALLACNIKLDNEKTQIFKQLISSLGTSAIPHLWELASIAENHIQENTAIALSLYSKAEILHVLSDMVNGDDEVAAQTAVMALNVVKKRDVISVLLQALKKYDDNYEEEVTILKDGRRMKIEKLPEKLRDRAMRVKDRYLPVRRSALDILHWCNKKEVISAIEDVEANDPNIQMRQYAGIALAKWETRQNSPQKGSHKILLNDGESHDLVFTSSYKEREYSISRTTYKIDQIEIDSEYFSLFGDKQFDRPLPQGITHTVQTIKVDENALKSIVEDSFHVKYSAFEENVIVEVSISTNYYDKDGSRDYHSADETVTYIFAKPTSMPVLVL